MLEYDELKQKIAVTEEDLLRAEKGNKAAGTRVRKSMQEIKALAQAIRVKILELR
ncbi:MAG TPA: histone H1 [Planctomycetota bacterium]|nr:histone H1 [Planctomycetota bacterium]